MTVIIAFYSFAFWQNFDFIFNQVNGNHETMNVEGDFRYVDPGSFDECLDFLEYMEGYEENWEDAFIGWIRVAESWKEDRKMSQSHWGPWNLMRVLLYSFNSPIIFSFFQYYFIS